MGFRLLRTLDTHFLLANHRVGAGRGAIEPAQPKDTDRGSKKGSKPEEQREDVDKLIKGVASYPMELKETVVGRGEYSCFPT